MNCAESKKHLENYLDERAPRWVCERIRAHLAGCLSCRERFQSARMEMDQWRRLLAPEKAPEGLTDRLMAAIAQANAAEGAALIPRRDKAYRVPRSSRWLAAAACVALLAGLGLAAMSNGNGAYHSAPYPVPLDTGTPTCKGVSLSSPTPCSVSQSTPVVPTPKACPLVEQENGGGFHPASASGLSRLG